MISASSCSPTPLRNYKPIHRISDRPAQMDPHEAAYAQAASQSASDAVLDLAPLPGDGSNDFEALTSGGSNGLSGRDIFLLTYRQMGDLRKACDKCGIKFFTGFMWAKASGNMTVEDKMTYGTQAHRSGATAEAEFQRLVPAAINANNVIRKCNPGFDFTASGMTVDVKYSSIASDGCWRFHFAKRKRLKPDFYACFFATAESGELADGYRLFLVPHEMFAGRSVMSMRPGHPTHPLNHYEIEPAGLSAALSEMGTQAQS